MSKAVRQSFPEPVPPSRELYIAKKTGRFNKLDPDWYVMAIRRDNTVYYVSQWAGFGTPLGTFGWNSNENIRFLIVLSCIISMAIAVVFWLIMRQISRPMAALNIWANHLDGETVKNEMPDFYFRELNKMASFLMEKISEEHDRMRRDQQFLHYASHELRTPITIISQNIEVLKKLTPIDTEHARMMREKAVKRLGRASDNMGALIETLLWMGRKTTDDLPRKEIRIDSLIEEIVKNLAFLLKGKQIKVNLDTIPTSIFVAETPLRIVLANLIRNAFYHTSNGSVTIHQAADVVTITNEDLENDNNSNLGFGFGLSLTSKLVRKMDWSYRNKAGPKGHTVSIGIKQSDKVAQTDTQRELC